MNKNLVIIFFSSVILFSQCTYHNVNEYFNDMPTDTVTNCDTVNVSFSQIVFPIIVNNCVSCHNDFVTYGDNNFDTYEGISNAANSGKLIKVIKHNPGYPQMPKDADKLPKCYIEILEAWINQGSKDN